MGHSDLLTPNGGLSKAQIMALSLLTAPEKLDTPMNYTKAWSTLNVRKCYVRYIPLVAALTDAVMFHFWVSYFRKTQNKKCISRWKTEQTKKFYQWNIILE